MRAVSLFSGGLGLDLGLEEAGIEAACYVEADPDCLRLIRSRRPGVPVVEDVREVTAETLAAAGAIDVVAGGFPCFPAGTLILARRGLIPIEDVRVDDEVLTHRGRWRKVLRHHGSHEAPTVRLRGHGHPGLVCTANHPLWTRGKTRRWSQVVRNWRWPLDAEAEWTDAEKAQGRFWSSPAIVPPLEIPPVRTERTELPASMSEDFLWFAGKWVADGHAIPGGVILSCALHEVEETSRRIAAAGLASGRNNATESVVLLRVTRKAVKRWLIEQFGYGAAGKTIPTWILGAPIELRRAFFDGYIAGDGHYRPNGVIAATTVSWNLAVGLRILGQTLGYAVSVYRNEPEATKVIEGRTVNQRPWFQVVFRVRGSGSSSIEADDGLRYGLVRSVEPTGRVEQVYNFEVEEDNSYVADGVVVKNCQDLSYAGRGAGLHEGERSALWFEMLRIVEDVRPRLVLAENVPGLLTRGLPVVLHGLARAGYVGRWFAVSAASVGAPHLRERIFVAARRVDEGVRAERLGAGHPVGEFRDDGWFDLQGSLFDQEPLRRLGKRGRWTLEAVFEEDGRLALDDGAEETLLPTPSAYESTPTAEFIEEVREAGVDPEARLYLPGRKWHAQRTLSRIAPLVGEVGQDPEALLPTPQGSDGERGPDYARQRERRESHGSGGDDLTTTVAKMLPTPAARDAKGPNPNDRDGGDDLPTAAQKLLPTPVVTDSFGSRRSTARTDEWTSNPGTTLTDAIWEAQGRETDTTGKLLPTPTATYPGGSEEDFLERKGREPDGAIHLNHAVEKLLPTPVANPDNPGSGGELRAAIEHGPERRNGTGVDSLGRPNEGRPSRLLPTPQAADGDGGRQEKGAMRAGGKRPSGQKGTLPLGTAVTLADEIGESPFTEQEPTETLLPTPETVNRKSRRAMTSSGAGDGNGKRSGGGMSSPPGLEQVAEIVTGSESRDLPNYEDLPPSTREIVDSVEGGISWGVYEAAVRRWEATCGREAPAPTDDRGRLSPAFVEWMMDYPEGWVSGLVLPDKDPRPDRLSRTAALRILGNSVVVRVGYRAGLALLALDSELSGA